MYYGSLKLFFGAAVPLASHEVSAERSPDNGPTGGRGSGNRREDLKAGVSSPVDPWDRAGAGSLSELCTQVSEVAGSAEGEAEASPGVQAGPLHRLHRWAAV